MICSCCGRDFPTLDGIYGTCHECAVCCSLGHDPCCHGRCASRADKANSADRCASGLCSAHVTHHSGDCEAENAEAEGEAMSDDKPVRCVIELLGRRIELTQRSEGCFSTDDGQFALTHFSKQSIYGECWNAQACSGGLVMTSAMGSTLERAVVHLNARLEELRKWGFLR